MYNTYKIRKQQERSTKLKCEISALTRVSFLITDVRGENPKVLSPANVDVLPSYGDLRPTGWKRYGMQF